MAFANHLENSAPNPGSPIETVEASQSSMAPKKEILAWAMFDFANQAYTLLIISVIFGDLFTQVIVGDSGDNYRWGNFLWSLALAVSYFMVVLSAPLFGALMDYTAGKKRFLFASYLITVVASCGLYWVEPGWILLAMFFVIISNFAYASGESFISSFLPELGASDALGRISGFGWALGYVGGLISTGVAIVLLGEVSLENYDRVRFVGPFAGLFFLVAGLPTFIWLRERGQARAFETDRTYLSLGFERILSTINNLRVYRDLAVFLLAAFFAMAAIYIVIAYTFIYGAQVIGWDPDIRVYMFVIVQITAALGALGFGFLQDRLGSKFVFILTLGLWIIAIFAIWATPAISTWINIILGTNYEPQHVFLVVACLAGACLGASQSAARALVAILSPKSRAAEFFGFANLVAKLAAILGLLGVGVLQTLIGLQTSILLCAVLLFIALTVVLGVDVERGREAARVGGGGDTFAK